MLKLHFYNHKTLRHLKKQSFYHCCKCCLCKAYSPDTFQTHLVYFQDHTLKLWHITYPKLQQDQDFLGPPLLLHREEEVVVFHGVL